jgi:uncharacterized protein
MRMTEVQFDSGTPVDGYGPGFFRVGGTVLKGLSWFCPAPP